MQLYLRRLARETLPTPEDVISHMGPHTVVNNKGLDATDTGLGKGTETVKNGPSKCKG